MAVEDHPDFGRFDGALMVLRKAWEEFNHARSFKMSPEAIEQRQQAVNAAMANFHAACDAIDE